MTLTRRKFIQVGGAAAGGAALASGLTTRWWGLDADRVEDPGTEGDRVVASYCELCFWGCGVQAHVKDGRVTKVVGNPDHPLSRGRLCPRGAGATGLLYDPDRLRRPLVRTQKRGEDVFEEVSWDAALNRVGEGLLEVKRRHGPEAVALFTHGSGGSWFKQLMKAWGSPNVGAPSYAQCRGPREAGYLLTFGTPLGSPEPIDLANARVITLIGSHLGENMHNTQVQELAEALGRGAQLVVVDPRFSVAASKARYWLPIKPGTDLALLLAWMNVMLEEKAYDAEYLAKHAVGLEELRAHVADKTPEWAYPITGIRPELIRDSARLIASARPASLVHPGRHTTWYGDDTQRARAMAILAALLGSWGRRGGYVSHAKLSPALSGGGGRPARREGRRRPAEAGRLPSRDRGHRLGALRRDACRARRSTTSRPGSSTAATCSRRCRTGADGEGAPGAGPPRLHRRAARGDLRLERRGAPRGDLPGARRRRRRARLQAAVPGAPPAGGAAAPRLEARVVDREGARRAASGSPSTSRGRTRASTSTRACAAGGHDVEGARRDRRHPRPAGRRPARRRGGAVTVATPTRGRSSCAARSSRELGFDPLPQYYPHEEPPPGQFRLLIGPRPDSTPSAAP